MRNAIDQYDALASDDVSAATRYYEACVQMMDDDLREELHDREIGAPRAFLDDLREEHDREINASRAFLSAYCAEHEARFGEPFIVN